MLISTNWLLDYLEPACTPRELLDVLPRVGLEIDALEEVGRGDATDFLAELNVLPNRPDCLGLIGMREAAAALNRKLKYPNETSADTSSMSGLSGDAVPVEVRDAAGCPRYVCQLIRGVKVGPSPAWLADRLRAVGQSPINNVVDITNYVLLEWGQPLHAFDFNTLRGGRIVVRRMEAGETLELLSGKVMDAKRSPLVIADAQRPVALAGVMGGKETATIERTTDVLLEAAHFEPVNIRKTVRGVDLGLGTPGTASSYRFERGTDPNGTLWGALRRATSMIVALAGGRAAGPPTDVYPVRREPHAMTLSAERVSATLGLRVEPTTIRDSLRRIEMQCDDGLTVRVPTWRADVNDAVVLMEDVARLVGYDAIPTRPSESMPTLGARCVTDRLRQEASRHLAAAGFLEARNPSLESPEEAGLMELPGGAEAIRIGNPANREMSVARTSLLPGLLASASRNLRRGAASIRLFEIDRAFWLPAGSTEPRDDWHVSGVAAGMRADSDWRGGAGRFDFFDLKGVVENLLDALRGAPMERPEFHAAAARPFVAGACAEVLIGGKAVGRLGEIAPGVVDIGKSGARLLAFEINLAALETLFLAVPAARTIPRTPAVTRDLAIVVDLHQPLAPIESVIRSAAGATLETLRLVDVYQGPQVPGEKKSLAFHLVFRDPQRTLTAEEAAATMEHVVKTLADRFSAVLRA